MPNIELDTVNSLKKALVRNDIPREEILHDLGILTREELFFLISDLSEEYDFVEKE